MSPFECVIIWLLAINIITVVTYRYDKRNSLAGGNSRRVSEKRLLLLALIGGSPGACIAMFVMRPRHKTRKLRFLLPFWAILIGQISFIWLYLQSWQRP